MAVLLIGVREPWAAAVVARLVAAGDDVRVIASDVGAEERLRSLGAYIARGPALNADLVERSAQNVRTVVLGALRDEDLVDALEGARSAGVDRVVVVDAHTRRALERVRSSGLDYVVLDAPTSRFGRRGVDADAIARAVDAADDLAGALRLELDLRDADAWAQLGLTPPGGRAT